MAKADLKGKVVVPAIHNGRVVTVETARDAVRIGFVNADGEEIGAMHLDADATEVLVAALKVAGKRIAKK